MPPAFQSPAPAAPDPSAAGLAEPPEELSPAQQAFWREWAPHALERQTLIPATAAGFRELCQQWELKEQLAVRIAKAGGAAARKVDGLLRHYTKLAQRVDASMARFSLTSFGKPADGSKKKPQAPGASPWAQVATR